MRDGCGYSRALRRPVHARAGGCWGGGVRGGTDRAAANRCALALCVWGGWGVCVDLAAGRGGDRARRLPHPRHRRGHPPRTRTAPAPARPCELVSPSSPPTGSPAGPRRAHAPTHARPALRALVATRATSAAGSSAPPPAWRAHLHPPPPPGVGLPLGPERRRPRHPRPKEARVRKHAHTHTRTGTHASTHRAEGAAVQGARADGGEGRRRVRL